MKSALVATFAALAVLSVPVECAEKVQLALYSEALCNGCIYYANSALNKAMNEVTYSAMLTLLNAINT